MCNQFSSKVKIFQSDGGQNLLITVCAIFLTCMEFIIVFLVHIHLSKMAVMNANTGISVKQACPCSFMLMHLLHIGLMLLPLQYMLLIAFHPLFLTKNRYEVLFGSAPNYANFKPFGCRVFPYLRDYSSHKLAPRSRPCIFLGYSSSHKGFRCHDPATSHTFITRHAQFDELCFPFSATPTSSLVPPSSDVTTYEDPLHHALPVPAPKLSPSSPCPPCSMLEPDHTVSVPAPTIPEPVSAPLEPVPQPLVQKLVYSNYVIQLISPPLHCSRLLLLLSSLVVSSLLLNLLIGLPQCKRK